MKYFYIMIYKIHTYIVHVEGQEAGVDDRDAGLNQENRAMDARDVLQDPTR
jgi:hypothetical protein